MPSVQADRSAGQQTANPKATATRSRPTPTAPMADSNNANLPAVIRPFAGTFQIDRVKFDLIKRTICPRGTTDDEMALFFHECARRGTHPMDRLIVMTKFRSGDDDEDAEASKVVFMTTIDYLRAQAELVGNYAGTDAAKFGPAMKFRAESFFGKGANRKTTSKEIVVPEFALTRIYKMVNGVRVPVEGLARWTEFYPGPRRNKLWLQMPYNQLAKCSEAQGLRKGWPQQLRRLYVREELDQAFAAEDATPVGRGRSRGAVPPVEPVAPPPQDAVTDITDAEASTVPTSDRWTIEDVQEGSGRQSGSLMWKVTAQNGDHVRAEYLIRDRAMAEAAQRLQKHRTVVEITAHAVARQRLPEITGLDPITE